MAPRKTRAIADGNEGAAREIGGRIHEIEVQRKNIWDRRISEMKACESENFKLANMYGWPVTRDGYAVRRVRTSKWEN